MRTQKIFEFGVLILFATLSISKAYPILTDENSISVDDTDEIDQPQQYVRQTKQLSTGSSDITAVIGPAVAGTQQYSNQPLPGNGFGNSVRGPGVSTARNPQSALGTSNKAASGPKQSPAKGNSGGNRGSGNRNKNQGGKDKDKDSSEEEDSNEDGDSSQEESGQKQLSYEDDSKEE